LERKKWINVVPLPEAFDFATVKKLCWELGPIIDGVSTATIGIHLELLSSSENSHAAS
jgi:hypothetical protein